MDTNNNCIVIFIYYDLNNFTRVKVNFMWQGHLINDTVVIKLLIIISYIFIRRKNTQFNKRTNIQHWMMVTSLPKRTFAFNKKNHFCGMK